MEENLRDLPQRQGMYDPANEHDACGVGFIVNIKGERSYDIVYDALDILENLKHRGGEGADHKSGDGAGIMVQIPHAFLSRECAVLGFQLPPEGQYGVGMIFAHRYDAFLEKQKEAFEQIVREESQTVLGWREVPVMIPASEKRQLLSGPGSSRCSSGAAGISRTPWISNGNFM